MLIALGLPKMDSVNNMSNFCSCSSACAQGEAGTANLCLPGVRDWSGCGINWEAHTALTLPRLLCGTGKTQICLQQPANPDFHGQACENASLCFET